MAGETPSSTHPPLPPTMEDERLCCLRLLRSRRVGVATYWRMLGEHGSAAAALAALPEVARAAGIDDYTPCPEPVALSEMKVARQRGARLICHWDDAYPRALTSLEDQPPFLWCLGDIRLLDRPMIALVGARNASSLGTRMARQISADLGAAGYVVVSGLARGIDAAAHDAALATGTVAVMAGGVDIIYPAENTSLAEKVGQQGLIVSEQAMGLQPQARHFPTRNRIVSGLAQAVVVIEAAAKSGSLITARTALDQGRDVFAVPGHPFDARAAGCNLLLRDGAQMARSARDVLELLGHGTEGPNTANATPLLPPSEHHAKPKRSLQETAALHGLILDRLGPSPLAEDQLIRDLSTSSEGIAPALIDLELSGQIVRQAGGLITRAV